MTDRRIDEPTGTETVGHEWDGIEELNTPLPRWWLWTFYACVAFSLGYVIAYPAWPLIDRGTEGVLGWTSRGQLADEMDAEAQRKSAFLASLAEVPVERMAEDEGMMRAAVAGGRAAFKINCVQCHGSGAAGSEGYPNLNDDDWLWGGDLKAIEFTLTHGVRQPGAADTRMSLMPAFGRDGILNPARVSQVSDYVLSLSGPERASAAGAELYATNCAVCHGPLGEGNRAFGAPDLADAIWLYGRSKAQVAKQVTNGRNGVMPAWSGRLDPVTIKMLAAYVHSLGGGEDFVEAAATPVAGADAAP